MCPKGLKLARLYRNRILFSAVLDAGNQLQTIKRNPNRVALIIMPALGLCYNYFNVDGSYTLFRTSDGANTAYDPVLRIGDYGEQLLDTMQFFFTAVGSRAAIVELTLEDEMP